jgi:hypothetical protein
VIGGLFRRRQHGLIRNLHNFRAPPAGRRNEKGSHHFYLTVDLTYRFARARCGRIENLRFLRCDDFTVGLR